MIAPLIAKLAPPWFVSVLFVYWCATYSGTALAVLALAAVVELLMWFNRVARAQAAKAAAAGRPMAPGPLERLLHAHPAAVCVGLVVFGVLIDFARVVYALGAFFTWFLVTPAVIINRQRYERAKAEHLLAQAQATLQVARTQGHVAVGTQMQEKARQVLARPVGLEPRQALEAAPAPVTLEAPVLEQGEAVESVAVIHGLVTTFADGRHQFDPLGGQP